MKTRAITGFFFIIIMLASVLLGHYVFGIFYLLLCLFCLHEFYSLVKIETAKPGIITGIISAILIYSAFALVTYANKFSLPELHNQVAYKLVFLIPVAIVGIFITELFRNLEKPFNNIAFTILGIMITVVPFTFFHALAYIKGTFSYEYPLAFLLMLWSNDTGAYLTGMAFGKHKLFERHSPKKTWEGFIGGIVISIGVAIVISQYFTGLSWMQWGIVGLLISTFGTAGDLVESMFKRSINVKDSGGILPGHGGLLDRFDGLFVAAPIVYTYLYLITN